MIRKFLTALLIVVFFSGCTHIGPKTVSHDRFDYNNAISKSWKEQTLLNIVKLRYADMPLFVDVASIVSGYTLQQSVNVGGTASSSSAIQGDFFNLGASGTYTDRPTITYSPITGQQFNASFMTPIPPRAILFLMQSGWSADLIFSLTVASINGLRSRLSAGVNKYDGDDGYYQVIENLRDMQSSGSIGMRIKKKNELQDTTLLFFYKDTLEPKQAESFKNMGELLQLDSDTNEYSVVYGFVAQNTNEIALLTRSLLQIMLLMATEVDVPQEHITEGRTIPTLAALHESENYKKIISIHSGMEKPDDSFVSVEYNDYWYWIEDTDFKSKRTFTFLMILFSVTETGGKEGLPLVTISSG